MNNFPQNVVFEVRESSQNICNHRGNQALESGMRDQIRKIEAEVHS